MECGHGWQWQSRGRASIARGAAEGQRRDRGARRWSGGAEHHPRRQDAPRATQSAHSGRDRRRGVQRHPQPRSTRSRPPQGRRSGARCRRWCGATLDTLTPCTAPQTLHGPRQAAQGAEHPPAAHRAHRGRTDAPQSAKRGEGHSYPPTAPREPQPPRMTRRGCATHLYEYG